MSQNYRRFQAADPFGRAWTVEFRWLQTAISIRHCDSVDVKFSLTAEGEPKQERVVALMHPDLLRLSGKTGHALTDAWCLKLAGRHLQHMIETAEDLEKVLVTVQPNELERYAGELQQAA